MARINTVNNSLVGTNGTGTFVGSVGSTLVTPTLGVATASSLTFSSTAGLKGTTTNNNATAGSVGELITSNVPTSPGLSLSSTVVRDITSITLTAGDWDIFGSIVVTTSASSILQNLICWSNQASATQPDLSMCTEISQLSTIVPFADFAISIPSKPLLIASGTTVYLSIVATFATGSPVTGGTIYARRRR